jgi:hypothetical protein
MSELSEDISIFVTIVICNVRQLEFPTGFARSYWNCQVQCSSHIFSSHVQGFRCLVCSGSVPSGYYFHRISSLHDCLGYHGNYPLWILLPQPHRSLSDSRLVKVNRMKFKELNFLKKNMQLVCLDPNLISTPKLCF